MARKILFLGQGSEKDPGFEGVKIDGVLYKNYMKERSIEVLSGYVESCHGCYDLMSEYSRELQSLVEDGDRVVAVLQGGLLFGLPSIQATQTTFPIISCPLDYVAYTSFMVPSGHSAIASVGVERKGEDRQRAKGLKLAERILNLENTTVSVFASNYKIEEKLGEKLSDLGVWHYKGGGKNALSLVYGAVDEMRRVPQDSFAIRADPDENVHDWEYLNRAEWRHHQDEYNSVPNSQARGLDNLAIFAAKIVSLQHPGFIPILKEIARIKRETYSKKSVSHELQGAS